MSIEAKLREMGLSLPNPPAAAGSYVPTVQTGNLLFCAGTICSVNGQMTHTGQVGREQTVQSGYESARVCALATLTNVKAALGSLERIARIVYVGGYVNAISGFADSPGCDQRRERSVCGIVRGCRKTCAGSRGSGGASQGLDHRDSGDR
jgi:enamine deaminase RidA (YjgF/YER057c/UK114 family)